MSNIAELIAELCPEGVPRRRLSEIGTFTRGRRFVKTDMVQSGIPCIHYGEMYTYYDTWADETRSFLEPVLASKLRVAHPGDIIIVSAGETIEDIGNGIAWLGKEDVVIHDACFSYSHDLEPKYVAYFLQTADFHSQIRRFISSAKVSSINGDGLGKALIPVPPIEVQREIVKILDNFRELESELKAELKARKKQYQYYRDKLLGF